MIHPDVLYSGRLLDHVPAPWHGWGVYALEAPDGRAYVGRSWYIDQRRVAHITNLRVGKAGPRLQAAYRRADEPLWRVHVLAAYLYPGWPESDETRAEVHRWHMHQEWLWCQRLRPALNTAGVRSPQDW